MYHLQVLNLILINCLLALGAYLPFSTGLMVACLGTFMSVGAIVSAAAHSKAGIPLLFAVIVGGISASICGIFVALICSKLKGFLFTVSTLGLGELARVVATNNEFLGGALGYKNVEFVSVENFEFCLCSMLIIFIIIFILFEKSDIRRALSVIKENEILATTLGINVLYHRVLCLGAGGFIIGIAGGFYIHNVGILEPRMFGFESSLIILMFPILGGYRHFLGPLIGAFLLTFVPEALRFSTNSRMILYGITLIIVISARPEGIIGSSKLRSKFLLRILSANLLRLH